MIATVTPPEIAPLTSSEPAQESVPAPTAVTTPTRWLFTVAQFERMGETGILHEDDRVELIEGEMVKMPPIGSGHSSSVDDLGMLLSRRVGDVARISSQNPLHLTERSQPQPDVTVLQPRADSYAESLATPTDVLLLIEVADSSLVYDRQVKLPLYAQAGIPEVWIVNLGAKTVEQYTQPLDGVYGALRTAEHGDTVTPTLLPDLTLQVAAIIV